MPDARPPLAARMRPRTVDEIVGQDHVLGPGRLLRRAIEADRLGSVILAGPPGCGKTTLARVIAGATRKRFVALNAVLAGVRDVRAAVAEARRAREEGALGTILFLDEVHRFNKAQQDALLPWVEDGTLVLVGATTENPLFEVNKALVSRSRIFRLRALDDGAVRTLLLRALADPERGYGRRAVEVAPEALDHLVDVANGDARAALNALELAVETTPAGPDGVVRVTLPVAEESIQARAVHYDRDGDAHFDTISAFIKSVRGSDPDAALYWLARMLVAGEDPRFLLRRLLILASEDVGLADPRALVEVEACAAAFDRVGLPEGRYHLAQATLRLALAPKSNSASGIFAALEAVERERTAEVPAHLRDPSRDKAAFGDGEGYRYPHAWREHFVAQRYLPEGMGDRVFYRPGALGWEGARAEEHARRREALLAAADDPADPVERWSAGPPDRAVERWAMRLRRRGGERMARVREAILERAALARHHLVLDLGSGTGLLLFEAVRRTPEGGVVGWEPDAARARGLVALAADLDPLARPRVLACPPVQLAGALEGLRFDRILGRDLLARGLASCLEPALARLAPREGRVILAESLPSEGQGIADLAPLRDADPALLDAWRAAEAAALASSLPPGGLDVLRAPLEALGWEVAVEHLPVEVEVELPQRVLDRWFSRKAGSYAARLAPHLDPELLPRVEALARARLAGVRVSWRTVTAILAAAGRG